MKIEQIIDQLEDLKSHAIEPKAWKEAYKAGWNDGLKKAQELLNENIHR